MVVVLGVAGTAAEWSRDKTFWNCTNVCVCFACVLLPCLLWVWRPGIVGGGGGGVLGPESRQQVPSPWGENQFKPKA